MTPITRRAAVASSGLIAALGVWYRLTHRALPASDVAFTLTGPDHPVGLDDEVIIGFAIRNLLRQARHFKVRFSVAPVVGDIRPTVIDPSGAEVPCAVRVRLVPRDAGGFMLLQPGEAVHAGFPLRYYYKITKPGTYRVSVTYVVSEIPPDLEKLPVFRGTLEAGPISVVFSGRP